MAAAIRFPSMMRAATAFASAPLRLRRLAIGL
jgi:hypothetical protein